MDNSPLGKLPAELRDNIWELVLQEEEPIELTLSNTKLKRIRSRPNTSLLMTCKALYYETRGIFYSSNIFHITIDCGDQETEVELCLETFARNFKQDSSGHGKLFFMFRVIGRIRSSRTVLEWSGVSSSVDSIGDAYTQIAATGNSKDAVEFRFQVQRLYHTNLGSPHL